MSMQTPPATPSLSDPDLLRTRGFIDGQWCDADDGGSCEVTNPATGAVLGTVPDMGAAETRRALAAARPGFPDWATKTAKARHHVLRRVYQLLLTRNSSGDGKREAT